jgi:hypothetical protein
MAGYLALVLSLLLAGCFGAYQVTADNPTGTGSLQPTVEDKDAGLVGIAPGFDVRPTGSSRWPSFRSPTRR